MKNKFTLMKVFLVLILSLFSFLNYAQIQFKVTSPLSIGSSYPFTAADQAGGWTSMPDMTLSSNSIYGELMFVEDGSSGTNLEGNPISREGCNTLINDLTGKIAVIYRNTCEFGVKALNAQNAGAIGVIIINRDDVDVTPGPGVVGASVSIPTFVISNTNGNLIANELNNFQSVTAFFGVSTPISLDFSNPSDWIIGNNAGNSDDWVIGTTGTTGSFPIGTIASTTAANGFALFDSDLMCSGNQNAFIYNAMPVDLSSFVSPVFKFESFYRKYTDQIALAVSSDNGTTWTSFPVHSDYVQNQTSGNPEQISIDISSATTNDPANVYFAFIFQSDANNGGTGCDYAWMVDDIAIEESNFAPIANDDNVFTTLNLATTTYPASNDYDEQNELDATSITITSNPTNGTAIPDGLGGVTYTPNTGFLGTDTYSYQVCDLGTPVLCDIATVTVNVSASDNDLDGYDSSVDCDDNNFNINPGATEIADNGIDEDCNGSDLTTQPDIVLDFSNPSDWVMGNNAGNTDNWVIGTTAPAGAFPIAAIASTTAANNFALFDSDLYCSGNQSAWIGNAVPLDLSAYNGAMLSFESFYRKYTDDIFLQVSTDNATWTNFQINQNFTTNQTSDNPQLISVNISSAISASPSTVYFRFFFLSDPSNSGDGCDYAWMVDDITINSAPSNDLILSSINWGASGAWGTIPYRVIPLSQNVAIDFIGTVINNGNAMQNDVVFNASTTIYNGLSNATIINPTDTLDLVTNTSFTPPSTLTSYDISFSVNSSLTDNNPVDNTLATEKIEINQFQYGLDEGVITTNIYNQGAGYEVGNVFNIFNNTILSSALVNVNGLSNPGAVLYAKLYEVDPTATGAFLDYFIPIHESTTTYTFNAVDGDTWVTIPFDVPQNLTAGKAYALVVGSYGDGGSTNDFVCNTSGTSEATNSIFYNYNDGSMYYTLNTPMVRMLLQDPVVTITSNDTDNNACNGQTITLTSSEAIGNVWSNGATTSSIVVASSGSYSVTVNGVTSNVIDVVIDGPVISSSFSDVSCNGVCDGSAVVNISDLGFGSTVILWNNGSNFASQTNLCAGSYNVSVTDMLGCSASQSGTVSQPAAIITTTSSTNSSCGNADGSATVVASGGTGGFSYDWSNGATTATASNLLAGSYSVTVTDNSGCSSMATASVSDAGAPSLTASSTNTSCNGSLDGTVSSSATGGTGTLMYSWSNGITTPNQSGLGAGTYSIVVEDANGCTATQSVTISQPAAIIANTSSTNSNCGSANGSATVVATGGTGGFSYDWSNGATTASASNLLAGSYTVIVTDNSGCNVSAVASVNDAGAPSLTASSTNTSCNGLLDGTVSSNATGGTGAITYTWSNGITTANQTGLGAGTYSIVVEDANGCTATQSVIISQPAAIVANASSTNSSCGNADGSATVVASGGTGGFSYDWSNGATTASASNLLAGSYSVTVTDNSGCSATASTSLSDVGAPILTLSSTNNSCNAACDGTASFVSAVGGTGNISLFWTHGPTSLTLTGLCAGTYTMIALDDAGCSASQSVTISQPSAITINTSSTSTSCNGSLDGTLSSNAVGGIGAITYTWSNGITTANQTGLGAGTYNIMVEDANGCSATQSVIISEPTAIIANTSSTNSSCGNADGSATVVASGGTGGFSYDWSNGATSATASSLLAGSYTVTVTDNSGCSTTTTASVSDAGAPSLTASSTNASCNGSLDGTVSSNATGGTGAITYTWSNGITTANQTGLGAGTYNIIVEDANGCSATQSVTISEPAAIIANTSATNSSCGNADGSATVMATGGTGGFSYNWSNGATTASVSNLIAGSYSVTVTDNSGCNTMATASVSDVGAPNLTASSTNASCNGSIDGTVSSNAVGGTGAITYTWSNGITTPNQTGLGAGTYNIVVEDANGCTATQSITIAQPAAIIVNTSTTNSSCGSSNGSATVVASGGTGGFSYDWSNGASTSTASNLMAGSYTVTATDNSGCSATVTASVSDAGAPSLTASSTNVSCNGLLDGTVSSNATGGTGAISYTWSNGISTPNQTGLGAGTYNIVVEDANGCTATQSVIISQPLTIVANTSSTNSSCGNADGSGLVIAVGGTGGFTYDWSNGSTGSSVSNLSAGTYTITITDNSGCSIDATVSILDNGAPSAPTITSNDANNSICSGESITLTSSSSTMNVWSTSETTTSIIVTSSGTYTLKLVDGNGCQSATVSVTIIVNQIPNVNAGLDLSICEGDQVTLSGTGAQTYTWDNGVINGQVFIPINGGVYTVIGTDINGCQNSDSLLITLNNCASIDETQTEFVSVYPNPSAGKFVVNLKDLTGIKNYTVLDQLGKKLLVETIKSTEFSVDLSSYSNGIYYLLFNGNELNQQQYKIEVVK